MRRKLGRRSKFDLKNFLLKIPISAALFLILAFTVNSILSMLGKAATATPSLGMWVVVLEGVLAAIFLSFALKYHPGQESFLEDMGTFILILTFAAVLGKWIPQLSFSMSLSTTILSLLVGLAFFFSEMYLAIALYERFARAVKIVK